MIRYDNSLRVINIEEQTMAYTMLAYHIVFSSKYREPVIGLHLQERLYEYMGGTIRSIGGHLIQIGGVLDHVHLLTTIPATKAVSNFVRELKSNSPKWINDLEEMKRRFRWQKGYAAFTVSHSQRDRVKDYIQNQEEHHRTRTFKEEYIEMLKRHCVPFEMKYLFEEAMPG